MASNDEYQQRRYWDKKGPTIQDYHDMVKLLTERGELPENLFPDYNELINKNNASNRENKEGI